MENENLDTEVKKETQIPVNVSINVDNVTMEKTQYDELIGSMVQIREEITKCEDRLYSVWMLLAVMVLFEFRRLINGITQRLRKVRK